jgi:hypothetical protein
MKIKSLPIWKPISRALHPAINRLWLQLEGKSYRVMDREGFNEGNEFPRLTKTGIELVQGDAQFTQFSEWLNTNIPQHLLDQKTKEMQQSDDIQLFTCDILPALSKEARVGVIDFALSDRVLRIVKNYFGFVPPLATAFVMLNVPKQNTPAGSQKWHRDSLLYRGLNFFIALSEVDVESGPYRAIGKDKIPSDSEIAIDKRSNKSPWEKFRIDDADMQRFVADEDTVTLSGAPGSTAIVDPALCYHKGGHCRTKSRLMIQISFQTEEMAKFAQPSNIIRHLGLEQQDLPEHIRHSPFKMKTLNGFQRKSPIWRGAFHRLDNIFKYHLSANQSSTA